MSITIENYSEYSVVVRGDTRAFKKNLLELEGKFNDKLKGGPGWIFSTKKSKDVLEKLQKDIAEGKVKPEGGSSSDSSSSSSSDSSSSSSKYGGNEWVSMKVYLALLARVERLEQICSHVGFVKESKTDEITIEIDNTEEEERAENNVGLLRKKKTKKL